MGEHGTRTVRLLAALAVLGLVAAACDPTDDADGIDGEGPGVTGEEARPGDLVVGTTDTVTSLDPARAYDYASATILLTVGETLMGFEPGRTSPSPLLAEEVAVSDDGLAYTFSLREDVVFHDGSVLDSQDVQFSLERAIDTNHPDGPAFLLTGIDSVEAPDDHTVEITLTEPDITVLARLASSVATIVPADGDYDAPDSPVEGDDEDALEEAEQFLTDDLVATGPYRLAEHDAGRSVTLEAFDDYWAEGPASNRVIIRFFATSSEMRVALERGEIDVAFRELSVEDREALDEAEGIQVLEGEAISTRYIVFNTHLAPVDDVNVRKAVAAALDRDSIVDDVFGGAAEPLYSMIPPVFDASVDYFSRYEERDPAAYLEDVDTPVEIDLHYGGEHYGTTEPSLARAIQQSLEQTGLFEVSLTSTEWQQYIREAWPGEDGRYPMFLLGVFPDYFDPNDYVEPFYASTGFLGFYANPEVDELIAAQRAVTDVDSEERREAFDDIQRIVADDAPIIPMVAQPRFVFTRDDVDGLDDAMDPAPVFRYPLLSRTDDDPT